MPVATQSVRKPSRVYLRRGHPLTQGLVGAWPLFTGAGTVSQDVSGHQNRGDFLGTSTWRTNRWGPVFYANESGDGRIEYGQAAKHPNNDFSAAAWVRPDSADSQNYAMSTGVNTGYYMRVSPSSEGANSTGNSQYLFKVDDGANGQFFTTDFANGIVAGQWNLVSMTADRDGNLVGYVDGKREGSGDMSSVGNINNSNNPLTVGYTYVDGSLSTRDAEIWDGAIGIHLNWNRTLTDSEHAQLFEQPFAPFITKPR